VPPTFLTPEGAEKLREELEYLKTAKREELRVRLREAIQMGDLSENADYIMAKEDQAFLEGRIIELESVLRNATVVHDDGEHGGTDVVGVGCKVTVRERGEEPEFFYVVGAKEADPRANKISNESPIGRALVGKAVGDRAKAQTPGGVIEFEVLKIERSGG
jgi:transcription elongation factor GreA